MFDLSFGLASITVVILAMLVGLWGFFLVNRASVRANEQVRLLREISEQQREQTILIKTLLKNSTGDHTQNDNNELSPALDFRGIIPER